MPFSRFISSIISSNFRFCSMISETGRGVPYLTSGSATTVGVPKSIMYSPVFFCSIFEILIAPTTLKSTFIPVTSNSLYNTDK